MNSYIVSVSESKAVNGVLVNRAAKSRLVIELVGSGPDAQRSYVGEAGVHMGDALEMERAMNAGEVEWAVYGLAAA